MQPLLNQLNSRDPAIRDAALRDARALPPDDLLQLVLLEHRLRKLRSKQGWRYHNAFFVVALPLLFAFGHHLPKNSPMIIPFITSLINTVRRIFTERYSRSRVQLSIALSQTEDTRFIAPMLRLQVELSNDETQELRGAAKRLLLQLRANHAQTWSKEDKAALLLPFKNPDNDKELTIACLKALEQVGDTSAIPAVRRLLEKMYPEKWEHEIAIAAHECLLYLQSNMGRIQQAETLLRASETAATRPNILLRPAQPAPDTTPNEQLLRPRE